MNNKINSLVIIKKFWKKYSEIRKLKQIQYYLSNTLNICDLQELSNKCNSISIKCRGDGAGLIGGTLIDILISEFLNIKLIDNYVECHEGECDMIICDVPLSLKKINGKSTIALNWSKNDTNTEKNYFSCNLIIVNLKSCKWWKNKPKDIISNLNICYCDNIPSGIYIIDKQFCKYYIQLTKNNKTNSLIDSQNLYIMLKRSLSLNLFIELPLPNEILNFRILDSFSIK